MVIKLKIIIAFLLLPIFSVAQEDLLFKAEFSAKDISGDPKPVWSWDVAKGATSGMMYGSDDIYNIVEGEKFMSNRAALRMNFSGRNDFCNTCGGDDAEVHSVSGGQACFNAKEGPYEKYVFNKSNAFSRWAVENYDKNFVSGEVCIDVTGAIDAAINGQESKVAVGDVVHLPKVCGVNGEIGGDVSRKSDCNKAINYLDSVSSADVGYGEVISRRFYLYIPSETELPNTTFKLAYSAWQRSGGAVRNSKLKISVQRGGTLELNMPNDENYARSLTGDIEFHIVRDQWMYFEEVFVRESEEGAKDARYQLYAGIQSKLGQSVKPIVEASGFELGELRRMSIGGNWQHTNDVSGYVYFDNIMIAKRKIGPVYRPEL
ncbi:hypothetical protein [Marinimicrobium agarilyticum]|uniref:hypothetical protein n=1 Tax=Marinimicrobium agarilyticum TaxID=306546 RepID=UPI0003F5181A|nr:hypothetical protein [Marinimicrobium agarilyticum]